MDVAANNMAMSTDRGHGRFPGMNAKSAPAGAGTQTGRPTSSKIDPVCWHTPVAHQQSNTDQQISIRNR